MTAVDKFSAAMCELPLVAILRGLKPAEAPTIGDVLFEAGFRLIEVPLNSPQPLDSIEILRQHLPQAVVGAGGAAGFGLGSSIFKPGDDAATVRAKAVAIVAAYRSDDWNQG